MAVPTHGESCLDHLYTNRPEKLNDIMAITNGGSDHKLIYAVRYAKDIKKSARYVKKRCFKTFQVESFKADIRKISWFDVYQCEDVEKAVNILTHKITTVLNKHAPIRTIQVRSKYAPWLSEATKELMQKRNTAQMVATISKNIDAIRQYRNLRNRVTNMIKYDKKNWERSKLDHPSNSAGNLWKNVQRMLSWSKGGPPTQLFWNGKMESRPKELARVMNSFFNISGESVWKFIMMRK